MCDQTQFFRSIIMGRTNIYKKKLLTENLNVAL